MIIDENSTSKILSLLGNEVTARWYQMGIVMGVHVGELEIIREGEKLVVDKLRAMIECWLRGSLLPQTWQVLVDAVEHSAGGNNGLLARQIAAALAKELD